MDDPTGIIDNLAAATLDIQAETGGTVGPSP
jgi:hypothetical protein